MISCRNKRAVSASLPIRWEVALDAFLFLAAERRVRHDHVNAVSITDLAHPEAKGIERIDLGRLDAVKEKIHLTQQERQWLRLNPDERLSLKAFELLHRLALRLQMLVRLDQEATRSSGWIE